MDRIKKHWMIQIALYALLFCITEGELYCFKKVHSTTDAKRGPICRGLMNKTTTSGEERLFRSARGCCRNGGAGYMDGSLVRVGKRGLKYPCELCQRQRIPTSAPPSAVSSTSSTSRNIFFNQTGWSNWGQWTQCSSTCSVGFQQRQRSCGNLSCRGPAVDDRPCVVNQDCPVNGGWGPWRGWSGCTVTCGGGNKTRLRQCNDPIPRHGGLECPGDSVETQACNTALCPVNGNWGEWSEGSCSMTCGKGAFERIRACDNPPPSNNGSACEGLESQTTKCRGLPKCPVDGGWSLWQAWGLCNASCGTGHRTRVRACVAPRPRSGGKDCKGDESDHQECYHRMPCPVNGGWTEWDAWGQCLAAPCTGARGYTTRKRTCKNPQPKFNGTHCKGNTSETQGCINNEQCPVNGGWCEWSNYTQCLVSNTGEFKIKTRDCGCPAPESGGDPCTGIDFETVSCLVAPNGLNNPCRHRRIPDTNSADELEYSGFNDDEDDDGC